MKWFINMKIANKLILAFIGTAFLTGLVGYVGISGMGKINDMLNNLYEKETLGISYIKEANIDLIYYARAERNFLLSASAADRTTHMERMAQYEKMMQDNFAKAKPLFYTEKGKELIAKFEKVWADYAEVNKRVVQLAGQEELDKSRQSVELANGLGREKMNAADDLLTALSRMKEENGQKAYDDSDVIYDDSRNFLIGIILAAVVAGIGMGIIIARIISNPIIRAVKLANSLAEGDLNVHEEVDSKDETGQLLAAMGNMVQKLTQIVTDVQSAADNVASGSQELASSSQEMSQGATEQAASIEEISSSMEEMVANIQQNTDNAKQTEQLAARSALEAAEGGKAVGETMRAMKEIAEKISIIEEIARQTNLLALNAAIEAARAGEAGKGFAVVASEVRKLAERSQTAAAQISSLSSSSVEVAEKAGQMLEKLVPAIQRTAELVQEVAAASMEQNTGASQVNKAIQQLDTVVQQNASASEEMASTAEELSSQAEQLQDSMSFFKIGSVNQRSASSARAPQKKHAVIAHTAKSGRAPAKALAAPRKKGNGIALDLESASDDSFESY